MLRTFEEDLVSHLPIGTEKSVSPFLSRHPQAPVALLCTFCLALPPFALSFTSWKKTSRRGEKKVTLQV